MSKLYIFGIGGTGSRVLRSFTMMMAAGVHTSQDEIVPIIIDPDQANADLTRTVALMNNYRDIRSELKDYESKFFKKKLSQTDSYSNYTLVVKDTQNLKFRQFIDLPSMDESSEALIRMLFSEENLDSDMQVGFKGNPNIGSVVLNQIADSEDFLNFANDFEQGDKIFIISSIFGGTGASGFPLLLKTLRTGENFPNYAIINKAPIGAVTVLPYFRLKTDDESEIDSDTFISKTKSALAYYEKNISNNQDINALYFLADDTTNTYENNEGGNSQKNDAHLIEFLAATAIIDFSNNDYQPTLNMELGLTDTDNTDNIVTFKSFCNGQKEQLYAPLTKFIMMANCLNYKYKYYSSKDFNANNSNFNGLYSTRFMQNLTKFTKSYLEWLQELQNNTRSLSLFNLSTGDRPFDVVTGVKPQKIMSTKSNYDLVTDRLNKAIGKCVSKNDRDKFLEMFDKGMQTLFDEKIKS